MSLRKLEPREITNRPELNAQDLGARNDQMFLSEPFLTQTMRSSEKYHCTYLWLKQKEKRGFEAVVREATLRQTWLGGTAGERLSEHRFGALLARDDAFSKGYKTFESVKMPGYGPDMILSDMVQLFDRSSTTLTQTEQGALLRRIELARNNVFNESIWGKTDKVVGMFRDMRGSTKPMPQGILLRAIPDEHGGGRCYPLVYAMSVALTWSEFAIDQLCAKLVALSPSKESVMESAAMFK